MKTSTSLFLATLFAATAAHALETPVRDITNPKTIVSPSKPRAHPVSVEDLYSTRGGMGAVWTAAGDVVVSTNLTGRFNLWKVTPGGDWPLQMTRSDDRQGNLAASPDGRWIVYASDYAGNELWDLFAVPPSGGEPVNLTATNDTAEDNPLFSPDSRRLAFGHKLKVSGSTNIAVMDLGTRSVRLLTHEPTENHVWTPVAWSADGRRLVANRRNAGQTEASVWLIDVDTGHADELTPSKQATINEASDISPDGRWIALTSDAKDGHRQIALFDVAQRSYRWLVPDRWEQESGHFSPDGRRLTFTSNADGRVALSLVDVGAGAVQPVPLPPGITTEAVQHGTSFSRDGRELLVSHQGSNTPLDYWVVDLATGAARQVTRFGLGTLDPQSLPTSEVVHYRSKDGTPISAILYMPANLPRDGKAPGVVLPHGGPTGQNMDVFERTAIALASRGYICIAPNVRGSTGYGKAFQKANYQDLGGQDLVDEVEAARFLVDTGYVDPKKIGITGGSYGGYMTLMALAKTPEVWAAGVEMYGILDWNVLAKHEDASLLAYQESLLGDPVKDKAVYDADSPVTYMHQERAPLLVLQGDNDIRVTRDQSANAVEGLRRAGRTVDVHFYPNEGHGFVKRENQIDSLNRTVEWFDKYLKTAQ